MVSTFIRFQLKFITKNVKLTLLALKTYIQRIQIQRHGDVHTSP